MSKQHPKSFLSFVDGQVCHLCVPLCDFWVGFFRTSMLISAEVRKDWKNCRFEAGPCSGPGYRTSALKIAFNGSIYSTNIHIGLCLWLVPKRHTTPKLDNCSERSSFIMSTQKAADSRVFLVRQPPKLGTLWTHSTCVFTRVFQNHFVPGSIIALRHSR